MRAEQVLRTAATGEALHTDGGLWLGRTVGPGCARLLLLASRCTRIVRRVVGGEVLALMLGLELLKLTVADLQH